MIEKVPKRVNREPHNYVEIKIKVKMWAMNNRCTIAPDSNSVPFQLEPKSALTRHGWSASARELAGTGPAASSEGSDLPRPRIVGAGS
jgi:hypothetical protein